MKKKCSILEISKFLYFDEIHRFQNLWRHRKHCYITLHFWYNKFITSWTSMFKHTCSWRDKLIVLWTLNRQAKICLRYTYAYFLWILSTIKMKFGQIIVRCMTNIFSMFLFQCWRLLETSFRFFYDFMTMAI